MVVRNAGGFIKQTKFGQTSLSIWVIAGVSEHAVYFSAVRNVGQLKNERYTRIGLLWQESWKINEILSFDAALCDKHNLIQFGEIL